MKPLLLALFLIAVPVVVNAQNAPRVTPPTLAPDAAAPAGNADFNADQMVFDDQKGVGVYTGDVTATQVGENFILYAQKVISSRDQKTATATQKLRIETRDSTIRGERLFANFDTKIFSITGSVVVSSYGKNDGVQTAGAAKRRADAGRKPVRIACERLDWNYDTRQATLIGNIRIVSGDSVGTCNQIIYDEPKNAARLVGGVRFSNGEKRQFFADELLLFVDSGQVQNNTGIRVVGPVNNEVDPAKPTPPKAVEAFPEPAPLGDDIELPKPPPDIDKFLPKAKATTPAKAPIEPLKTEVLAPETTPATPDKTADKPAPAPAK